ncbi:MAG: HAMP domain-containing histidine kinase [Chloroflexota bacterium]|nr:HAMP domain-containing histidine kinase [Chloroflexota bacterium]
MAPSRPLAPDMRPLVLGGALALALIGAALFAVMVLRTPAADVQQLVLILLVTGAVSLLLGAGLMRWGARRWASLRLRLTLAWAAGLTIAAVNVVTASALMFINSHDRSLLLLLLAFGAAVSLVFGYNVTAGLIAELSTLGQAARRLSEGDLGARVGTASGDEIGRLAATFDQMAYQLQTSFERERALEAARRELVAAVSHDLRTPVTTIRAMIEAITDGVVTRPAEVRRYLTLMRGEVQHLSRLIDDLSELSQIDSGALQLRLVPTDLLELLAQTLAPYQAQARDQDIRLEYVADPDLLPVLADPARLQRVLRNLLDNALQHTPAGGTVHVAARLAPAGHHVTAAPLPPLPATDSPDSLDSPVSSDSAAPAALVTVRDTGTGVAPEDAERVFDRFYRGAPERPRVASGGVGAPTGRTTGAGLGLAIARGLIQAHGGRIWAEPAGAAGASTPGEPSGAVFRFIIPLVAPPQAAPDVALSDR